MRDVEAHAREAVAGLSHAHARPAERGTPSAPARPGLYAIHASPAVCVELGLGEPPDERPLYVGKSESSLAGRDITIHFGFSDVARTTSVTGYSTVRRSLAALLHDTRAFRGVPRNRAKPGNFSNYGLLPNKDEELSASMRERLRLACWAKPEVCGLAELERIERRVFVRSCRR
jgi:hypothetical protein